MVIQRWQTVLLFIAAVLMGVFSFCELAQIQTVDTTYSMTTYSIASNGNTYSTWYFLILSAMTVIIPFINIFFFKNLRLQRKLCKMNVMLIAVIFVVACIIAYTSFENALVNWNYLVWLAPILACISSIWAANRITSDENKLRSADRIR